MQDLPHSVICCLDFCGCCCCYRPLLLHYFFFSKRTGTGVAHSMQATYAHLGHMSSLLIELCAFGYLFFSPLVDVDDQYIAMSASWTVTTPIFFSFHLVKQLAFHLSLVVSPFLGGRNCQFTAYNKFLFLVLSQQGRRQTGRSRQYCLVQKLMSRLSMAVEAPVEAAVSSDRE
jgi:hypothetical protein